MDPMTRAVPTALDPECCEDFARAAGLSRRRFLAGMAAASGATVATSMFGDALRQTTYAATTGGNVLVVISLRGGIDGLGMVVPHGDPAYAAARRNIALPTGSLVAPDAMFGLHPRMAPLQWMWDAGEMAAVHAVGLPVPNRSHFQAMEQVEDADPTSSGRRGWLNRMVGLAADGSARSVPDSYQAVGMGVAVTPTSLVGPTPVLAAGSLDEIELTAADGSWAHRRRSQLGTVWRGASGPLGEAARSALSTVDDLGKVATKTYKPAVAYPRDYPAAGLSDALKDTAQLIKADVGTEVVTIDYGSWDMHSNYGTTEWGSMQSMVGGFAATLSAFLRDLGPLRSRVTVVTLSEFGRRVQENGNRGLDHGWGNMMLLMGGGVAGGRYYASWPGLGSTRLQDGDLAVTTDYRNVLGEVVTRRFPDRSQASVFPGLTYQPMGVMRAS